MIKTNNLRGIVLLMLVVFGGIAYGQKGNTLIGTPVYYDKYGNPSGSPVPADSSYHMPEHHYLNYMNDPGYGFNAYFLELEGLLGPYDLALGMNFTYLPERWGAYGSFLFGIEYDYVSVGPVLRVSSSADDIDWHLYGGMIVGPRVGFECGLRLAAPSIGDREFCWLSGSIGMAYMNGSSYLKFGMSLELGALAFFLW